MSYLKELRLKANLTQEKAAVKIGVKPRTLIRWEQGQSQPNRKDIARIREVYGLSDSEVLALFRREAS